MESSLFNVTVPLREGEILLYNSISKAIVRLNRIDSIDYMNECFSDVFYPTWNILRKNRMLTTSKIDQYNQLKTHDLRTKKIEGKHLSLTLMMSEGCNFSCSYCNQGLDKDKTTISEETIDKVIEYIEKQKDLQSLDVSWYGGEPLLSYQNIVYFAQKLITYCKQNQIDYKSNIITNGYLLTVDRAKGLFDHGVRVVQISLDGSRIDHDQSRFTNAKKSTYDIIMHNVKDVLESIPLHIVSRINVTKDNINRLKDLIDDIVSLGLGGKRISIYFAAIYDPSLSNLEDTCDISEQLIPQNRSYALVELDLIKYADVKGIKIALDIDEHEGDCLLTRSNSFAIDPHGNLFKCYIPISNKEFSVGSVNDFQDVTQSELFTKWDSWSPFTYDGCKNCKLLGSCRGGCPLHFVSESHKNLGSRCPTSKYAFNEHIFRRALNEGIVAESDWDSLLSQTNQQDLLFNLED